MQIHLLPLSWDDVRGHMEHVNTEFYLGGRLKCPSFACFIRDPEALGRSPENAVELGPSPSPYESHSETSLLHFERLLLHRENFVCWWFITLKHLGVPPLTFFAVCSDAPRRGDFITTNPDPC